MGASGGAAVELSSVGMSVALWGADDAGLISWLGDKLWIWGAVALGIGFVIFVHELGHFLAAKLFGVKVEKFYVGFDVPIKLFGVRLPRTLGKFRWGETEYGIGVIPLGGYVKMLGQDDDPRRAAEERERIRKAGGEVGDDDAPTYELDPRSYPAKSVWQRMVIISAGVVMNLITSVLFAAVAFGFGVAYMPAVIGETVPGYPAWQAGLEPGGRIVSAGGIEDDPNLHFVDMTTEIFKASLTDPEQPVPVAVRYDDEVRRFQMATAKSPLDSRRRLIGIGPPTSNRLHETLVALPNTSAAAVLTDEDRGAQVVEVDGRPLSSDPSVGVPLSAAIAERMVRDPAAPIELTLERVDGTRVTRTLAPQPLKTLGLRFAPGRVSALVEDGPAEQAGVRVGDRIVGFGTTSGVPSAFALPQQIAASEGPVQLTLERGEGEDAAQIDVSISRGASWSGGNPVAPTSGQVELPFLGLAYRPEPTIVAIEPASGGEDEEAVAGLEAGDVIERIAVRWPDGKVPEAIEEVLDPKLVEALSKGWQIGPERPLTALVDQLQIVPAGTEVRILAARGEQRVIVETTTRLRNSDDFWYDRGLLMQPVQLVHTADSMGEAFALGLREANRKLGEVFSSLQMIFTGRVSRDMVGGPVAIVSIAGSAASLGITSLLLFLTFLSVNLAILNFLPIPALDGGHMVFLIAEAVRGKPVDEELQAKLTMAGVLALLSLMAFVFINDFINLAG